MTTDDVVERVARSTIIPQASIAKAIAHLEQAATGMLLLCETDGRLYGVVTDGDIRRAILDNVPLTTDCGAIACRSPIVAPPDITPLEALELMDHGREFVINHLPLVDADGCVAALLLRSDLVRSEPPALSAVIMAGGFGTRLRPLTEHIPKPMLPVGDRPLLERTINRLRNAGIQRVHITTHYLADAIVEHFGNGQAFGVDVQYVAEDRPLGTAGALKLMQQQHEPVLVLNGDILTAVDVRDMLAHHRAHNADITIGVRQYDMQVPYGVVEGRGAQVSKLCEKPRLCFLVNAGIYLLEPSVYRYIPDDQRFDMTDLIQRLLDEGRTVVSFPIVEYWLDIGQHADYERAQEDVRLGRVMA